MTGRRTNVRVDHRENGEMPYDHQRIANASPLSALKDTEVAIAAPRNP